MNLYVFSHDENCREEVDKTHTDVSTPLICSTHIEKNEREGKQQQTFYLSLSLSLSLILHTNVQEFFHLVIKQEKKKKCVEFTNYNSL